MSNAPLRAPRGATHPWPWWMDDYAAILKEAARVGHRLTGAAVPNAGGAVPVTAPVFSGMPLSPVPYPVGSYRLEERPLLWLLCPHEDLPLLLRTPELPLVVFSPDGDPSRCIGLLPRPFLALLGRGTDHKRHAILRDAAWMLDRKELERVATIRRLGGEEALPAIIASIPKIPVNTARPSGPMLS